MTDFTFEVERMLCYLDMNPLGLPVGKLGIPIPCDHDVCMWLEPVMPKVAIVNPRYQPEVPGRYSGPPEDCYPTEGEEIEFEHDPNVALTPEEITSIEDEIRDMFYEDAV